MHVCCAMLSVLCCVITLIIIKKNAGVANTGGSVSGERSSGPGERRMGECELANAGEWVKACPFHSGVVANGSKCSHSLV